jgi:hypothetical protein
LRSQNIDSGNSPSRFDTIAVTGQCLNRRIPDKQTLEREVAQWQNQRNFLQAKIDWRFSTDDARIKLKRLYPTLLT